MVSTAGARSSKIKDKHAHERAPFYHAPATQLGASPVANRATPGNGTQVVEGHTSSASPGATAQPIDAAEDVMGLPPA